MPHDMMQYAPFIAALTIVALVLTTLGYYVRRYLQWRHLLKRKTIWLELTPPAGTSRTPRATQELFNVIHGFKSSRSLKDRLLAHSAVFSFEINSTKAHGIRFVVQVDTRLADSLQHAITSYLPQIKVVIIDAPVSLKGQVVDFHQTGHYAFPFAQSGTLERHDPVSYLAGAMTKLDVNEEVNLQIILIPVHLREATLLAHKILSNEDLLSHLSGKRIPLISSIARLINSGLFMATDSIGDIYHGQTSQSFNSHDHASHESLQIARRQRPARTLSAFELELMETMHDKLSQQLFRVNLRLSVAMNNTEDTKNRLTTVRTSLQSYTVPSYQSIQAKPRLSFTRRLRVFAFKNRLPAFHKHSAMVLSSSELGSLYHFPINRNSQTDNLVTSLSRTLPAPVSLKQDRQLDIIFGQNEHHGTNTNIGLTEQERERHIYIIGGTGNGKTTMLQYQIVQDLQNGKGLAIIDPHGDMAEAMLRYVPVERIKDVIYFNPDDLEYPIGLNLLELTPGLVGNELLREKDLITESVISVFRKIFSDEDAGGHRIEYVLRNAIQTALTIPDATLFTVFDLLNDSRYRKQVVKNLEDKNLISFWKNELGKAGDMQKVKMAAGITSKIGRFLFSASARQILEQPKSTIDFDDIINSGKILICNFSKGLIGEDTSELFGITVLAKLQLASLRRARLQQKERRAFYLYVDEFQNFATQSFVQMLSESRKYKLFMVMAEQSTSQQEDQQMVGIILANVGTVICFRTGNPQDEKVLLPLYAPYIDQGEISNLSSFNFYAKLSAMQAQEPLSGHTLLLNGEGDAALANTVKENSRTAFTFRNGTDRRPSGSETITPVKHWQKTQNENDKTLKTKSTRMLDVT